MAHDYMQQIARINLEIERSKISREKSLLVLNKGFFIYLMVLFVAIMGLVNNLISAQFINMIIVLGIIMLLVGIMPYMLTIVKEEKRIQELIDKIDKQK